MSDYKITQISQNAPREWKSDQPGHGTTYYIRVRLEGHERPVEIGKKKPDALKVGDTVSGTITAAPDFPADKFKAEYAGGGGFGAGNRQPKDEAAIKAMWAIGQARSAFEPIRKTDPDERGMYIVAIENLAKELFAMVDRVKGAKEELPETMTDKGDFAQVDDLPPVDQLEEPF